jgi:hypothetical protein
VQEPPAYAQDYRPIAIGPAKGKEWFFSLVLIFLFMGISQAGMKLFRLKEKER